MPRRSAFEGHKREGAPKRAFGLGGVVVASVGDEAKAGDAVVVHFEDDEDVVANERGDGRWRGELARADGFDGFAQADGLGGDGGVDGVFAGDPSEDGDVGDGALVESGEVVVSGEEEAGGEEGVGEAEPLVVVVVEGGASEEVEVGDEMVEARGDESEGGGVAEGEMVGDAVEGVEGEVAEVEGHVRTKKNEDAGYFFFRWCGKELSMWSVACLVGGLVYICAVHALLQREVRPRTRARLTVLAVWMMAVLVWPLLWLRAAEGKVSVVAICWPIFLLAYDILSMHHMTFDDETRSKRQVLAMDASTLCSLTFAISAVVGAQNKACCRNLFMYAIVGCVAFVLPSPHTTASSLHTVVLEALQKVVIAFSTGLLLGGIFLSHEVE